MRRRPSSAAWRLLLTAFLLWGIGGASAQPAQDASAAPRLALLIANTTYSGVEPLVQLRNDATALAEALRQAGFDTELKLNLSKLALRSTIATFRAKVKPGATVLLYLGGYGIQVGRQNDFIPVDAQIWVEADVVRDGINIESILSDLNAAGARIKLAVLDLSRRNPFERNFRGYSAGLGSIGAPLNTLVISAAGQHQVITDAPGEHGIFMRNLLNEMRIPDATAETIFNKTRLAVSIETRNEQVPWVASSLTEEFYFRGRAPALSESKPPQRPAAAKPEPATKADVDAAIPKATPAKKDEAKSAPAQRPVEGKVEPAKKMDAEAAGAKPTPAKEEEAKSAGASKEAALSTRPGEKQCREQVSVREAAGVADLQIADPCRKGTTIKVNAGEIAVPMTFDQDGKAQARIPLFREVTNLFWPASDGTTKTTPVRFAAYRDALRIALVWRTPVDLQMHVVEPGSSFSSAKGHVSRQQPNTDFNAGLGRMSIVAAAQTGAERIEVYDLPADRNPRNGLFKVYVDFAARGNPASPPYCGKSDLADPSFEIWVLRYGQLEAPRRFGFRAADCGSPISGRRPNYFADVNAAP